MYYADMTSHMHTVYRQGGVVIHRINATLEDVAATINKPSETTHSAVCWNSNSLLYTNQDKSNFDNYILNKHVFVFYREST